MTVIIGDEIGADQGDLVSEELRKRVVVYSARIQLIFVN